MQDTKLVFRDIFNDPRLTNLFIGNPQFRLIDNQFVLKPIQIHGKLRITRKAYTSPEMRDLNSIVCDSTAPLATQISNNFKPTSSNFQSLSLRPKFLCIIYTVQGTATPISQLRLLELQLPEIREQDGKREAGVQKATYHLLAVIRFADESRQVDNIRTYWQDGEEIIIPAEVGTFREKEPEAKIEDKWTVEDAGEYYLFYYRVRVGVSERASNIDLHAAEVRTRH